MAFKNIVVFIAVCCGLGQMQTICKHGDTDTCKCDLVNGTGVIDISFGNKDHTALYDPKENPHGGPYVYAYNPCYEFTSRDGSISGLASIIYSTYLEMYFDLGQQKKSNWKITENGSLAVFYTSTTERTVLTSTVILVCDEGRSTNNITPLGYDSTMANHNFIFTGPALCPKKDGAMLSVAYFSIVGLIVLISFYMVVKLAYKRTRYDETDINSETKPLYSLP